jgi:tetrahydromethanopterin S-methyltransferase subunit D
MAAVVWLTTAVAIWHFTVFVPDRFWSGIVGAFLGSIAGGMIFGAIVQIASSKSIGDTDITTVLVALPGAIIGMAVVYFIGVRQEANEATSA